MTNTIHESASATAWEKHRADPAWAEAVHSWAMRVRSGEIGGDGLAVFGQTHARAGRWPVHQIASALRIQLGITSGQYATFDLPLPGGPRPDRERDANESSLKAAMPHGFYAAIYQENLTDSDGLIQWDRAITLTALADPAADPIHVGPGSVPVEIGTTWPSRTLLHLKQQSGVARWPYKVPFVRVILDRSPTHALAAALEPGEPTEHDDMTGEQ